MLSKLLLPEVNDSRFHRAFKILLCRRVLKDGGDCIESLVYKSERTKFSQTQDII